MVGWSSARSVFLAIAGLATGSPVRQWPAGCGLVDSRGRRRRRLPGLLFLPAKCRSALAERRLATPRAGSDEGTQGHAAGAVGDRRFADQAVWTARPRSRHPSRSHPRPQRQRFLLWPRLGDAGGDRPTPSLGDHGTADLLVAVRPQAGRAEDPETVRLDLSDQAGASRRSGDSCGETAATSRQTGVVRGRRSVREATVCAATAQAGRHAGRPSAKGRRAVRSAARRDETAPWP